MHWDQLVIAKPNGKGESGLVSASQHELWLLPQQDMDHLSHVSRASVKERFNVPLLTTDIGKL